MSRHTDVSAGESGHLVRLGGVYSGTFASAENVGADETTFISRTMPVGFWPEVGACFLIESILTTPTSGPARHLRVYTGADVSYESGAFNATSGGALAIRLRAYRINSTHLAIFTDARGASVTDFLPSAYVEHAVDYSAGITISVRGQSGTTGDLVYRVGHSRYYPVPAIVTLP